MTDMVQVIQDKDFEAVKVIDVSSDDEMEDVADVIIDEQKVTSEKKDHLDNVDVSATTPMKILSRPEEEESGDSLMGKQTSKLLLKEQERLERENKKEQERLDKERKREEEKRLKDEKRLQKEQEKKKKEEERDRMRKEKEAKQEQIKKEKEERERQRQKEKAEREAQRVKQKEEKEQQKLKEKLEKEKEREQKELEKKKAEEVQKKKQEKLQIFNFFKPRTTVKSVTVTASHVEDTDAPFYVKTFKDFCLRDNAELHNWNRLQGDELKKSISDFDIGLKSSSSDLKSWFLKLPQPAVQIITKDAKYIHENSLENAPLRIKYIKFYENVKSWNGTYTKPFPKSLALNPFEITDNLFIDWDDEVDENEEGEGEDISENEDDDEEEDDDDDIDDFLERDQQSPSPSQTMISGPLIPKISWKGANETNFKIEILKSNITFPINPMEDYWNLPVNISLTKNTTEQEESPKLKKAKSLITDKSDLEKFVKEVNESDYTIPTMVEILKKQLPNYTKMTIENTLKNLAKRVGPKSTERKWQVNTELLNKLIE